MPASTVTSTDNTRAINALQQGIASFNNWGCDAIAHIDTAIESDPQFVCANATKGLILLGVRHTRFYPVVETCLSAAQTHCKTQQSKASAFEQQLTELLGLLYTGRIKQGVERMRLMLVDDPTNLFVHRLVQQELFWMGEVGTMSEISKSALPAWTTDHPDYGGFLSVLAFSLEEAGELALAEDYGRQAVALNPHDCWGTHAVAHVLEMQHRSQDGVDWLKGLSHNWQDSNQIKHHLWWHLCLFLLEQNAHDEALDLLTSEVRNIDSELVKGMPDAYIDLQNVASLLLRLELRRVDVKTHWQPLAEHCVGRIDNHTSPFTSAHAAMVLAASGWDEEADRLIESMQAFAAEDNHDLAPRFALAGIPAAKAAIAHRRGHYQAVVDGLTSAMPNLWRMGGSHAQRDVFTQILFDACRRLELKDQQDAIIAGLRATGFMHAEQRSLYAVQ